MAEVYGSPDKGVTGQNEDIDVVIPEPVLEELMVRPLKTQHFTFLSDDQKAALETVSGEARDAVILLIKQVKATA